MHEKARTDETVELDTATAQLIRLHPSLMARLITLTGVRELSGKHQQEVEAVRELLWKTIDELDDSDAHQADLKDDLLFWVNPSVMPAMRDSFVIQDSLRLEFAAEMSPLLTEVYAVYPGPKAQPSQPQGSSHIQTVEVGDYL